MAANQFATLDDWIAKDAISFAIDSADSLNAAIDQIVAASDPFLEVLGLGEPTHLVNDYLRLRNRVFQALVERHHFSAIAIESSYTRSSIVNNFILGRVELIDNALDRGITHNMGRVPGNRDLLEWIRRYNAEMPTSKQLRFYGFDSPTEMMYADSPRQLLAVALEYVESIVPAVGKARREQIEPLIGPDADWENPSAMMDPAQSVGRSPAANALRIATEDLSVELAALQPVGMASDPAAFREATRCAAQARQMLAYHVGVAGSSTNRMSDLLGLRDRIMADNLTHIAEQERPQGRVFAFAHNTHLKRGPALWEWGPNRWEWWPAGAHLSASMGRRYGVIGVGVGTSGASKLGPPESGSLEAGLLASPGPARVISTHAGRSIDLRSVPVRTANPQFFPFNSASLTDFDWLIVLDEAN